MVPRDFGLKQAWRGLVLPVCLTLAACSQFPPGTVLVVVNRTETPILLSAGVVAPCSEEAYDQAAIDAAVEAAFDDTTPPAQPGTVDLTNVSVAKPPGIPGAVILIVSEDGISAVTEPLDRDALPACRGNAKPPLPGT